VVSESSDRLAWRLAKRTSKPDDPKEFPGHEATTLLDGRIDLTNGVHRWAVATELEVMRVPVRMTYESAENAWS
jgi:hypothetical protein